MARPSKYTIPISEEICEAIATSSNGLNFICDGNDKFPSSRAFYRWLEENEELRHKYARARERQADFLADEIITIADDSKNDSIIVNGPDGETYENENREWVNRSKLRVDARKWKASKLAPKVYGDKIQTEHSGTLNVNPNSIKLADGTEIPI